jgi:(E)-4-hydroxy-3-methylbut-2-enyl-diphosphate synthase
LFVRGTMIRVVPEAEMIDALVEEAERIVAEGIDARLAAADADADAIAAADREQLVELRGSDANRATERIERIREITDP